MSNVLHASQLMQLETDSQHLQTGSQQCPAPPRKRKWRLLQKRIDKLKDDYNGARRSRTVEEYWQAMSHCIKTLLVKRWCCMGVDVVGYFLLFLRFLVVNDYYME
jgi:hypothetical protein